MSLYPTRDRNFTKATERRLQDDSRKHVYGSQTNSLLVTQSYPELVSPKSIKSSTTNTHSTTSTSTKHYPNTPYWSAINISNYTIIKKIGSGTYGSVFHARSPNDSDVAIKQLCPMQNDKHLVDGFHITAIREIKILKSLQHTNIISLNDVICCKENVMNNYIDSNNKKNKYSKFALNRMQTYMVFEYMHHDLSGLLHNDQVKFNIRHIKYFLCQILNALEYCHETALILHRDIKSSNLLVDNYGVVKIADFGLARQFIPELQSKHKRIASRHESVNNYNVIHPRHYTNRVVTLWYRSPELLLSDVHYTPAVDLWSVGCVFAELLFNKPIFTGKNEMEQWFQIIDVCGWNMQKEIQWINVLKDKDNLIGKMKKKSKIFNRKLKQKFNKFLSKKTAPNDKYLDENGFQLLDSLLTINPNKRISAKMAKKSEWFGSDPFPKPPQLHHIQPSHDYEQRQQRKNPNYRSNHNNNNNNSNPNSTSNNRYQYSYNNYNRNNNSNNNNNNRHRNNDRNNDRSISRSRSRSRERKSNNNKLLLDRSRSGSFDGRDNSISLPPPIQRKPPTHNTQNTQNNNNNTQQKQVVTLSAPSLRIGNRNQNINHGNQIHQHGHSHSHSHGNNHNNNGFIGGGFKPNYNPEQPHTFYSRFKRPDELKGRSRF